MRPLPALIAAFLATILMTACGGAARSAPDGATRAVGPSAETAAELEVLYRARRDSARMRFTEADIHFMTQMIAHHAQALIMARLAPARAASPSVRILAARIDNAQEDEIATMQQWLRDRGQTVPEAHLVGTEPMAHGDDHQSHMRGMLSASEMRSLENATGIEFDRLFLSLMIQHHRGAVLMVHELFLNDGAGQDEEIFRFASDAQVDQTTEIARMERMLSTLPPAGAR
jgi:uncharacterized protein (DUF305 family)